MADLSKVKISGTSYDLKDAAARDAIGDSTKGLVKGLADEAAARAAADTALQTNIDNEASARSTADSGLDTRIRALEARGRYLSTWDASTGLPGDYPTIPEGAESPYTYTYKAGDYYIINNVPASGTKYMPDGASITATKSGETWTWSIGKKAYTGSDALVVGGQFLYSTSSWSYVATAKDVAWGNITGTLSSQTDLQDALDDKVPVTRKVATIDLEDDITTAELQTVLGLEDLAYADTASGKFTPAGTIAAVDVTPAGTIALGDFTQTSTVATISTKADFTPAGSVTGDAIKGGSISVTVKDASAATAVTDLTYENYTPAGTIAAKSTGGTSAVLASAALEADASGVAITGTVSKPNVTVTAGTEKTFATGLTGGKVASFTEGAFTAAAFQEGFYTAGSDASLSAGAQASLTAQSTAKFVKKAHSFTVGTGADAETLIIGDVENTDTTYYTDAVTDRGTFTANTLQTLTGGKATVIDTAKFSGGSKAADTFVANELQGVETDKVHDTPSAALAAAPEFTGDKFRVATTTDTVLKDVEFTGTAAAVKLTGAKYLKQEIDEASFTGTAATLGFTGTKVEQLIPTEIKYDKATANGATFTGTEKSVTPVFTGTEGTVTVTPNQA